MKKTEELISELATDDIKQTLSKNPLDQIVELTIEELTTTSEFSEEAILQLRNLLQKEQAPNTDQLLSILKMEQKDETD